MWLIAGERPVRLPRIIILTHALDLHYHQPQTFPAHFSGSRDSNMARYLFRGRGLRD